MDERKYESEIWERGDTSGFESSGLDKTLGDGPRKPSFTSMMLPLAALAFLAVVALVAIVMVFRGNSGSAQGDTDAAGPEPISSGSGSDSAHYEEYESQPIATEEPSLPPLVETTTGGSTAGDVSTATIKKASTRMVTSEASGTNSTTSTTGTTKATALRVPSVTTRGMENSTSPSGTTAPPSPSPIILCTTRYPGPGNDPPDGLCDIVVYDTRSGDISQKPSEHLQAFIAYANSSSKTECGLNIEKMDRDKILAELATKEGGTGLQNLWSAKIRHYGTLRTELTPATEQSAMDKIASLLSKLHDLQQAFARDYTHERGYIFWGVSPLLQGNTTSSDAMKQLLMTVLWSVRVNILVYQTTFLRNGTQSEQDCVSTGPAMWKNAPSPNQPTFEDALTFRKSVELPRGTMEMLSFTLCSHWARFPKGIARAEIAQRTGCMETTSDYPEDYFCPGGSKHPDYGYSLTLVPESQQYVAAAHSGTWTGAVDLVDTIKKKMCMASVEYDYRGSWAIHSLQCNFKKHCRGSFQSSFPRVQAVKQYMKENFTEC